MGGENNTISRLMNRTRSHRKTLLSSSCSSSSLLSSSTSSSTLLSSSTSSTLPASSTSSSTVSTIGRNDIFSFQSSRYCTKLERSTASIDTSSQWEWQRMSMSSLCKSLSALMPTPTRCNMAFVVTTTTSCKKKKKKKKKRKKKKKKGGSGWKIEKRKEGSGWKIGNWKSGRGWKIGKRKSGRGWKIGKRKKTDGGGKLRERTLTSPTMVVEERVQRKLEQKRPQQDEVDEALPCEPQERQAREQRSDEYPMIVRKHSDCTDITDSTDITGTTGTTDTTDTTYRRKRDYPHHHYRRQHEIQMRYRTLSSQEPEVGFNKLIKLNRISSASGFLLVKMRRERTRIQRKKDMLNSDLDMYINLHRRSRQKLSTVGAAASSSSSLSSEAVEVSGYGGGSCGKKWLLSESSENSTTTGNRTVLFAI